MALMRKGESPGGCTSKEQCEKYCFEEDHMNECIDFGLKAGVMTEEEAVMARKVGGKGPGGCRSKTQCDAYCEEHSEECFNFAKEHGLMSEKDLERMSKGMEQFRANLEKMPPEAVQCLEDAIGEENFEKIKNGQPIFDRSMEGKMKSCFGRMSADFSKKLEKLPPQATQCIKDAVGEEGLQKLQSGEFGEDLNFESLEGCFKALQQSLGGGGNFSKGGFEGPGGCKSMEECVEYCTAHHEECAGFSPPGGGGGGFQRGDGGFQGGGPGGCRSEEECRSYCEEHPDECGGGGGMGGGGSNGVNTGGGFNGPGGCASIEGCIVYCRSHTEDRECRAYTGGGEGGAGFSGPGGCASIEDCVRYCQAHFQDQECQAYIGGGGGGGGNIGGNSPSCAPAPLGLVSWWKGESSAQDSADGNSGALSGGAGFADDGKVGKAFKFNKGSVNIGNPANLNFGTGPFSLEAWFRWDGGEGVNNIIRKSNYPSSGPGSGYWFRVGNGTLEFSIGETTQSEGQTIITAPVASGVWHYAVGTKDDSGGVKLYVDGESRGTILRSAPGTQSTSDDQFTLGSWRASSEFFSGLIDEVSVYNRALNASEVQAIFNAGNAGKCSVQSSPAPIPPPGGQIPPEYCSYFTAVPSCSYVGPAGSQDYNYCKQCFPDK